jgi:hypothetical protein
MIRRPFTFVTPSDEEIITPRERPFCKAYSEEHPGITAAVRDEVRAVLLVT